MKIIERDRARELRKKGKSINQIVKELGYSKASVSVWVRDIVLTKSQKNKLSLNGRSVESIEKRRINRLANEYLKTRKIIENAKKEITNLSKEDLKLIGIILYVGEGAKTSKGVVSLTNADPDVVRIAMKFFREICNVPEYKFRAHIHTFENADVEKTEKYWSGIIKIPKSQFYKTYIKQSIATLHKRKTLPYGTISIYICDTKLLLTIMGWIEKIKELVLK